MFLIMGKNTLILVISKPDEPKELLLPRRVYYVVCLFVCLYVETSIRISL